MKTRYTVALSAAGIIAIAFLLLWFVGQEASADPNLVAPRFVERIYPGSWPPPVRGLLWLLVGVVALAVERLLLKPRLESKTEKRIAAGLAYVAATCFFIFSIASFMNASWSIIH